MRVFNAPVQRGQCTRYAEANRLLAATASYREKEKKDASARLL